MKRHHPSNITFVITVLFGVSLALTSCAESTPVDAPTATIAPSAQVQSTSPSASTRVLDPPPTNAPPKPGRTKAPTPPDVPMVMIGNVSFNIELAETSQQVTRGLSGRDSLVQGTGMLFVHKDEKRYTFWMKDIRFPLDMIWIDARCRVADISAQVPPPEPGQSDPSIPLISPNVPVLHVLEINAGAAAGEGISIGDAVRFAGTLEGRFGC